MEKSTTLCSNLGKVRGLGAAHHGFSHWWLQRVTAVAIVPLSVWFAYNLFGALLLQPDISPIAHLLASPFGAVAAGFLLLALFVHAKLGLQVVIEDYVRCPVRKYSLLIGTAFLCYGAAAVGILSVLKLHFLDMPM